MRSKHLSSSEEIRRVVGATSVGAALLMIFGAGGLPIASEGRLGFAFVMLVALEVVHPALVAPVRAQPAAEGLARVPHRDRGSAHDAAIVREVADRGRAERLLPGRARRDRPGPRRAGAPPFIGLLTDATRSIDEWSVEAIVVASPTLTNTELGRLQQLARREGLALRLVARVPHMLTNRLTLQPVGPLMTVAVRPAELTGTQAALKRAFDVGDREPRARWSRCRSSSWSAPRAVSSPGPVLFRQQRVTRKDNRSSPSTSSARWTETPTAIMDEQCDRPHPAVLQGRRRTSRHRGSGVCCAR